MTNPLEFKIQRIRRGMTQKELAKTIGCSESKITRIETGRVTPSRELLERIAAVLDVSSDYLAADGDRGQ